MGLRQQIMDKEVMAIEEIELSRRTEEDLYTPRKVEKMKERCLHLEE